MSCGKIMIMGNSVGRLQSLLPSHQFDVIVGSLLGDGRLECRSKGIRHAKTARFRAHHGDKQREYVDWKYKILKDFTSTPPRMITRHDKKRGIYETSYYFHTRSMSELGLLHEWFYVSGTKRIPINLKQIITPRMLAVWYMDDGSFTGSGCTLNTHSFSVDEQKYLAKMLRDVFGIKTSLVKDRHQYKLSVSKRDFPELVEIVKPYITKLMSYKIAYPRNDLSNMRDRVTAQEASTL
jgi:recombination protein RecA